MVHAVEAGFIAVDEGEGGGGGEGGEGAGDGLERGQSFAGADLLFEQAGFDGPEAMHAPVGGDHLLEEGGLDGIRVGEADEIVLDEGVEALRRFAADDDVAGESPMFERVPGGALFSFRSHGAAGAFAVGTGRIDSTL